MSARADPLAPETRQMFSDVRAAIAESLKEIRVVTCPLKCFAPDYQIACYGRRCIDWSIEICQGSCLALDMEKHVRGAPWYLQEQFPVLRLYWGDFWTGAIPIMFRQLRPQEEKKEKEENPRPEKPEQGCEGCRGRG